MTIAIAFFVVGMSHGRLVTRGLTGSPFWSRSILGTRWRYANLPVGGAAILVVSLVTATPALLALSAGYTLAAVGFRFTRPT